VNDEVPDYLGLPLGRFLELVASEDPTPAGGSVAAVAVALAASLCAMAARLSKNQLPDAPEVARRADHLRDETASLARADAAAYAGVLATGRGRARPTTRSPAPPTFRSPWPGSGRRSPRSPPASRAPIRKGG
jgi:Formiminotransferase-cyclodeaminase